MSQTNVWRTLCNAIGVQQETKKLTGFSVDSVDVEVKSDKPVMFACIADWHAGSYGTDHGLFEEFTDFCIRNGIRLLVVGDMLQMSIKMRSVTEIMDNAITPEAQLAFWDSWLEEVGGIKDEDGNRLIIAGSWDNHSVMRTESQAGIDPYGKKLAQHAHYFKGIGHIDLKVGGEVYKLAMSHFFRGRSMFNPCHGQFAYARQMASDRELIIAGDSHTPGILVQHQGGQRVTGINCGTLQTKSGYGQRFFAQRAETACPGFALWPDKHQVTTFYTMQEMVDVFGQGLNNG